MSNNKKILLVKTHGCSACKCMEHILDTMKEDLPNTQLETMYVDEVPNNIKKQIAFNDFPTTIFIKDNNIVYWFTGTKSIIRIKAIINHINF